MGIRTTGWAMIASLGMVACSGDVAGPVRDVPPAAAPAPGVDGAAAALAVPNAVFLTTPGADARGVISGATPLTVRFNNCPSRPGDPEDDLKYTYDFDGDGTVDASGHCRWDHTFSQPASPRVCVSDRRENQVCQSWEVRPAEPPPAPVPTPSPTPVPNTAPQAQFSSFTVSCAGGGAATVRFRIVDAESDTATWTASVTGGTLTSAATGGPEAAGNIVAVTLLPGARHERHTSRHGGCEGTRVHTDHAVERQRVLPGDRHRDRGLTRGVGRRSAG